MNKILIVEDDPMLSEIYQKKFSKEEDFEVLSALSGDEAVKKTKEEKPDLVLLDLVLPEKDGFQILKELREDSGLDDIKIVIFSNLSQEEEQQKAKALGANGFIAKSNFTPQQIVTEVKRIIKGADSEVFDSTKSIKPEKKEEFTTKGSQIVKDRERNDDNALFDELGFIPKVLIVEDEEVFLEVFGIKLKDAGFDVDTASNGGWGLKLSDKNKYDIILLDIVMPVMNGVDLIKKIRKQGLNKETPVIVLSGSIDEQSQRDDVLKAGAMDVLIKTKVTPSEVVDCVKGHIDKN